MKKVIATTMAAFLVAQVASAVSASVDFASAYVFRGATFNDGFVVQPSIEGEVKGFTVGVWANIDADETANAEKVSEIDLYLGYGLGSVAGWDISAGYCEYTYPGVTGNGQSEVSLTASGAVAGFDLSVSAYANVAVSATPDFYEVSTGGSTSVVGVPLDYGISAGFMDGADSGFGYAAYSVSYETGGGTLSVSYVDELDDALVNAYGNVTGGVEESVVVAYSVGL